MSQNFRQPGDYLTLVAAPYDVLSGQGVLVNNIFGIASNDAESGQEVVVGVTGVWLLDKVVGDTFNTGSDVYYDTATFAATSNGTGTTRIGVAIKPAQSGDTSVEVRLVPQ